MKYINTPTGLTNSSSRQHDVNYSSCVLREHKYGENVSKSQNAADRKMVKSLDSIPWKKDYWGMHVRAIEHHKQKLGLGRKKSNCLLSAKSRFTKKGVCLFFLGQGKRFVQNSLKS